MLFTYELHFSSAMKWGKIPVHVKLEYGPNNDNFYNF